MTVTPALRAELPCAPVPALAPPSRLRRPALKTWRQPFAHRRSPTLVASRSPGGSTPASVPGQGHRSVQQGFRLMLALRAALAVAAPTQVVKGWTREKGKGVLYLFETGIKIKSFLDLTPILLHRVTSF